MGNGLELTHSVLIGYLGSPSQWTTIYCIPCFSLDDAVKYKENCDRYYEGSYEEVQVFVIKNKSYDF